MGAYIHYFKVYSANSGKSIEISTSIDIYVVPRLEVCLKTLKQMKLYKIDVVASVDS